MKNEKKVDQKIINILKNLRVAHQKAEQYYATDVLTGVRIKPRDIFKMSLAFDNEKRILIDLDLAYSEKHPDRYTHQEIEYLKQERIRLTHRIRAWQHRQFPSRYKD